MFLVFAWGLRHLAAGRAVYATGSDPEAARLAGIRPRRVVFGVFVVMGALTGLAALLTAIQFIDVQTNAGVGLELQVIAAVVVGGMAISGGRGTSLGTLLGVALLGLDRTRAHVPGHAGLLGARAPGAHHPAGGGSAACVLEAASGGRPRG